MNELGDSTTASPASRGTWIATWGTAQQLARPAESGGGPQMPGLPDDDASAPDSALQADEPPGTPTKVGAQTVRAGSARELTFGGRAAVVLPTGAHI